MHGYKKFSGQIAVFGSCPLAELRTDVRTSTHYIIGRCCTTLKIWNPLLQYGSSYMLFFSIVFYYLV